ncbi:MAG TPA: peptidylprolyl isomerase [Candidatus Acidoferrum sp.]|nr:peptidylprolyl isomerase [Candidatus Acidoferrum sp.]
MRKSWLVCALLGGLAWSQAAMEAPPPPQPAQTQAPASPAAPNVAKPAAPADTAASVPADAAVITVRGVCPAQPKTTATQGAATKAATTSKTSSADCKTVITKAEFEKLMSSIPNANPQTRKQVASVLPRLIAMSDAAKKKGLDKTSEYEEMLKIQKMQLLSTELQRKIQEDAAKVPPADIENYYKSNQEAFQQFNLDRLFIPRTKQVEAETKDEEKDEKPTEEQQKAKQAEEKAKAEQNEQAMTKLAEDLRTRAAAGEDFVKLQKEAFEAAGMKIESPTVALPKVRRTGLPAAHAAAFDLKPGEVSQVINDSGGHYIYKLDSKDQLTLDQAKQEIQSTLQTQRSRDMMDKINNSFKVETNEAYFGPGGPGPMPGTRGPGQRMPPPPAPPAARPQTPPAASQPPAQPPAAQPN